MLKASVFGLSGIVLAACGQPASPAAPAANTGQAPGPTNAPANAAKPTAAAAAPQSTPQAAAAQAGAGLTTDQISLLFMGHVAGGQNEQKAYDDILAEWQNQHPNIKVEYQVVPDAERITKAQAMVAADQAPDMWRHNADVIRLWASRGILLDLTDLMPKDYGNNFLPGLRAYCIYKDRMWGLPHTTDTSALFYREDALQNIGVTPPTDIANGWTWQQFGDISDKLVAAKKQQYAFTHNQGGGRWVPSFLYSAGGKVVTDDFKKMAINSPEGIEAFTFLKQWTDKKWAPPAIWTTQVPNEDTGQFVRGTASMAILGQWNITYLDENIKDSFKWNVTYLPKDKQLTTSLGGTPVVGWIKTQHPKEVAAFFQYFTSVDKIKQFDEMANYVPVRSDMASTTLNFQVRNDLMQTFKNQMPTLPEQFVAFVARSYSNGVSTIITEESSKLILSGQSPEDTAKNIETRGNQYIQDNPDVEAS
jgi:multiple sugar transport system substrate-binding protein